MRNDGVSRRLQGVQMDVRGEWLNIKDGEPCYRRVRIEDNSRGNNWPRKWAPARLIDAGHQQFCFKKNSLLHFQVFI